MLVIVLVIQVHSAISFTLYLESVVMLSWQDWTQAQFL